MFSHLPKFVDCNNFKSESMQCLNLDKFPTQIKAKTSNIKYYIWNQSSVSFWLVVFFLLLKEYRVWALFNCSKRWYGVHIRTIINPHLQACLPETKKMQNIWKRHSFQNAKIHYFFAVGITVWVILTQILLSLILYFVD